MVVSEKGLLHLDLEWRGASAHAAYPWLGRNPVDAMLDDLARLRALFAEFVDSGVEATGDHWHPTATVTTLESESRTLNRVPAFARAGVDVRFTPLLHRCRLRRQQERAPCLGKLHLVDRQSPQVVHQAAKTVHRQIISGALPGRLLLCRRGDRCAGRTTDDRCCCAASGSWSSNSTGANSLRMCHST